MSKRITPLISICIPTYNRARFLQEGLESIINQLNNLSSSEKIEIVISNDNSPDNTYVYNLPNK